MTPALQVRGLVAGYARDLPILHGVDLRVPAGTMAAIIGPNGAGKSTLIKAIAGLVPVSGGTVALDGTDITGTRPDRLGALGLAYVPQTDNIFRTLTVAENLVLALRRVPDRAVRLAELHALFPPLAQKARERAGALSGGQRQMLAVAMALATRPRAVLMDEPSAGLAPKVVAEVLDLARGLTAQGTTVVLVEQNVREALRVADHVWVLAEGENRLDGPAADLRDSPALSAAFLGGRAAA
jgi:branched-chain amino acid transport system ATP-binding protein